MPHPDNTTQARAAYTVTFQPGNVVVPEVPAGETLLRTAARAGIFISSSCGGAGSCGKCVVQIESGQVEAEATAKISSEDWQRGVRLACISRVVADVVVRVPRAALTEVVCAAPEAAEAVAGTGFAANTRGRYLEAIADDAIAQRWEVEPSVRAVVLSFSPPTTSDRMSDLARYLRSHLSSR